MVFSPTIQPVELGNSMIPEGTEAVVAGYEALLFKLELLVESYLRWGHTSYPAGFASFELKWIKVKTVNAIDCRTEMTPTGMEWVHAESICALSLENKGAACVGDSGSPLVAGNTVIGILSWGMPCATSAPDVYTRIEFYRSWIDSIVG